MPSSGAYYTQITNDGPFAYYQLDEQSGTVAIDSSTAAVNATYNGSPVFGGSSLVYSGDYSTQFNGTNAYVSGAAIGTNWGQSGSSMHILECWFVLQNYNQTGFIMTTNGWGVGISTSYGGNSNVFVPVMNNAFTPSADISTYVSVPTDGKIHYLCVIITDSSAGGLKQANQFYVCIDGVWQNSGNSLLTGSSTISRSSGGSAIAGDSTGANLLNIVLDQAAFFQPYNSPAWLNNYSGANNVAKAQAMATQHYNTGKGATYSPYATHNWTLDIFSAPLVESAIPASNFHYDTLTLPLVDSPISGQQSEQPFDTAPLSLPVEQIAFPTLVETLRVDYVEWAQTHGSCPPPPDPIIIYTGGSGSSSSGTTTQESNSNFVVTYYYRCPVGTGKIDGQPMPKYNSFFSEPYVAIAYPTSDKYAGMMLVKSLTALTNLPGDMTQVSETDAANDIQRLAQSLFAL